MTGLEKITGRILDAAKADAKATLDDATARAGAIRADYTARAEALHAKLCADAEKEGEDIIRRAKSSAAMTRREVLLRAKSDLIDETFRYAAKELYSLSRADYTEFLAILLVRVLCEQEQTERESRELYGEEDAPDYSTYELFFNEKDRREVAEEAITAGRRFSVGKLDRAVLDRLKLSDECADIDGGFILRCGDIETNCSIGALLAEARSTREAEVCAALFH